MIYNVVLVPGVQQRDSVIHTHTHAHTHIYILFHIRFPYRLLQDIEYSSLCYTVGPCCFHVLAIVDSTAINIGVHVSFRIMEKKESSYTVGGNVDWCSHYGEQYGGSLKS